MPSFSSSSSLLRCFARATRTAPPNIPAPSRLYHTPRTATPTLLHPSPVFTRLPSLPSTQRHESTSSNPSPQTGASTTTAPDSRLARDQVPAYEMTFTCSKCTTRSSHRVSKQGYHHGTVLITCPGCKNRHLMSDHLKIFSDKPITIEDLMREKGQFVKKGSLSAEGDVEFWDDGTTTPRSANFVPNTNTEGDPDAEEGRLTESPALSNTAPSDSKVSLHKP